MGYFKDGVFQLEPREAMEEPASYPGEEPLEVTISKLSEQEIRDFWSPEPPTDMELDEMFDWYVAHEKERGGVLSSASTR